MYLARKSTLIQGRCHEGPRNDQVFGMWTRSQVGLGCSQISCINIANDVKRPRDNGCRVIQIFGMQVNITGTYVLF